MTEELRARIDELIKAKRVVVFMKGTPMMPMCGFSAATVAALKAAGAKDLGAHDVLRDPDLRQGIKEYSSWPTIPQVYIAGQFVGGCDIIKDLAAKGELAELISAT
jgi:monothiol glutaredoxin